MKYAILLAVFGIMLLSSLVSSFSISTLYSPGVCKQLNASYLSCPDGVPIKVVFSLSAPYNPPYLGNFTAYPVQYWNTSEVMNVYGNGKCIVSWSSTSVCMLYLDPIPPVNGNGIINRAIPLKLASSVYPQVTFNRTINVTISHYITSGEAYLLSLYNNVYANLTSIEASYNYFCKLYSVCSPALEGNISLASNALSLASQQLNNSLLYASYYNISLANTTLDKMYPSFQAFINSSNKIVENIITAKYILANITNTYYAKRTLLENCTFPNGSKYSTYINNSINMLSGYSTLNTLNNSEAYLSLVKNLKANETSLINVCQSKHSIGISFNSSMGFKYVLYLFGAIIIILAAYALFRLNEIREVNKVRSSYSKPPEEAESSENTGIKEVESVDEGTTQGYFDKWFSSTVGGEQGSKEDKGGSDEKPSKKKGKK